MIREGIKRKVDWKANGYEFCGEGSDGEMALPLILKTKPDILITDIKMPFMDGIELSRIVKKELPDTEILVLTGYEKFEYAKECINIGVSDYLSKPISGEMLLQKISETAKKIEERQKKQELYEKYAKEIEDNQQKNRMDFFRALVTGELNTAGTLAMAANLDLEISAACYCVMLIKIWVPQHTPEEYSKRIAKADEKLRELIRPEHMILFERSLEGYAILFKGDEEEALAKIIADFCKELVSYLESVRDMKYFGGLGTYESRISRIADSYESANHVFAHRFFVNKNCIMGVLEAEKISVGLQEEMNVEHIDPKRFDQNRVLDFLKLGSQDEIPYFVEELFDGISDQKAGNDFLIKYLCMEVYFCAIAFVEGIEAARELIPVPDGFGAGEGEENSAKDYIEKVVETAMKARDGMRAKRYDGVVEETIRFLEENYADPELSLNMLAAHVNFSPNHLSLIFSKQTGQTLIKYLTDYRIGKAKELLRCSNARSSEICVSIGYRDPHYFSYLFKKSQGMTPTQYRESVT